MQVTETSAEGLKRQYRVVLPASDLAARLEGQLAEMKDKVRINGFRPGKVPAAHLRRLYGKSIMGEVVQNAVNEVNRKIIEDNGLKLAMEPKFDMPEDQAEIERVLSAEGDFSYTVNFETLPAIEVGTFSDVAVEKLVTDVPESEVDVAIDRMANQNRTYTDKEGDVPVAVKGDRVTIDFVGKIDGEPFEGGAGTDIDLVLGSDSFIPGFEAKLEGMAKGENRTIDISFPENYAAARLAGQAATFDVTVKNVSVAADLAIDDAFAKNYGFDTLDAFRTAVRANIEGDFAKASREKMKRALLDALDTRYTFALPEGLVEQEFEGIWRQLLNEQASRGKSFEDEGRAEEEVRAEYRKIAERRVRLGLVLAEVGEKAAIKVEDNEVTQALVERVRGFPGQEKMVWEYYQKNPQALAEIRAPIFEEKVVDHILASAKVNERKVSKDELFAMPEDVASAA